MQNEYINESSTFAEFIQKEMSDRLTIRNRGVKQANFVVLQGAQMPAVLIETAFLSNPSEEKKLRNPKYQHKLAKAVFKGIQNHLKNRPA